MQIIRGHNRNASVIRNVFGEIRDLGARLEHLVSRYERLVGDVETATAATAPDLEARVRMANRELSFVVVQIQQLLVEKHEAQKAGAYASELRTEPRTFDEMADMPFAVLPNAASA